jgi:hypothetical protein
MTTLSTLRKELILNNDKLINAKEFLKSMENDPLAHFKDIITTAYNTCINEQYENVLDQLDFISDDAATLMESQDYDMYREGLNNYADGFNINSLDEYIDLEDQIEELESEIMNIEEEIEELENK